MINLLRTLADWLEDRNLTHSDNTELVFEIEERRRQFPHDFEAVTSALTRLMRGGPDQDDAATARQVKALARTLEKNIRQSANLLLEMAERIGE
jgi:hypothetical protein